MNVGQHILIVDDEPTMRDALRAVLSPEGYDLDLVSSGPEALAKADELTPDLVLLDVMMPGMDGFEVCQRLRRDPVLAEECHPCRDQPVPLSGDPCGRPNATSFTLPRPCPGRKMPSMQGADVQRQYPLWVIPLAEPVPSVSSM
jgi:hypothetical protein